MSKLRTSLITAFALCIVPMSAYATSGYVCRVNQYNFSGFGTNGGVLVTFYSGPNCTGSLQFIGYACTANSTTTSCSSSTYYTYSEAQLQSIYTSLIESGRQGSRIDYVTSAACRSGGTSCLQSINFYAD